MKKMPRTQPFYYRALANIFGLNFLELSNIKDRILNLKLINYYLSQTGSGAKNVYKLYENFYVLIARINGAENLQAIKLPDQKKFTIPDTIKVDIQETKQNYRDLVKLIQYIGGKKLKSEISDPDVASISQLYTSSIISEKMTLDLTKSLTKKFIGEELVPMDVLDEKEDEGLIKQLLKLGESTILEVKKSFADNESIGKAISAFANTRGGKILVGFDEFGTNHDYPDESIICRDFAIVGLDTNQATLDDQKKKISLHLHEAGIDVGELIIDSSLMVRGNRVCVIEVPESKQKPVFYRHEIYKRVGAQNKKLSNKEALSIFIKDPAGSENSLSAQL
jgi:predicted HTH transcriptional regulator